MAIREAVYSSIGDRIINEDCYSVVLLQNGVLALVADGLGGHGNGDIASKNAVKTISDYLSDKMLSENELYRAIVSANSKFYSLQTSNNQMKTTIAVLWIQNDKCLSATVGDTRIYQFRNNRIIYQSIDHSMSQLAVTIGLLSPHEIRGDKDRNKLIRALGAEDTVKVDIVELALSSNDSFLLCTDGFWELITESMMCDSLICSQSSEDWLIRMQGIIASTSKIKKDNNTAVIVSVD